MGALRIMARMRPLRLYSCTMSVQGVGSGRYAVVPRTLVLLRRGDDVLLLRRAAGARILPGCLNGVGGHVEAGEDLVSAAIREIREETGLTVRGLRLAGIIHVSARHAHECVAVFVFSGDAVGEVSPLTREGALVWVPLDEVGGRDLVPDLPAILSRLWIRSSGAPFLAYSELGGEPAMRFADPC